METYDYVVLCKEDCLHGEVFDVERMNSLLTSYGNDGYRVIEKLYNSSHDWVLILSRPFVFNGRRRK